LRILLINPPHPSIGSRVPREHLPPLGLLSVGGPLVDAGHHVTLLDADPGDLSTGEIVARCGAADPHAILIGHSGSTSAHPVVAVLTRAIRQALPQPWIVYGGVFPTYHWAEILEREPQIDVIVRGEGEVTAPILIDAIEHQTLLGAVRGIAYRDSGSIRATPPAPMSLDLDAHRVGWELADLTSYSYWGGRRAAAVQFSRGCPHLCHYCGQRGFWSRWRHRDPGKFAAEIGRLHRELGIEVFNLADENPTTSGRLWRQLLEALVAQNVPVMLLATMRAADIVRDADILPLYRRAGLARVLLGLDHTDPHTLRLIRKGSSCAADREAIRLLRRHGIVSMVSYVAGFGDERDGDHWRALRQLVAYDPDLVQTFFATPHAWTPYARSPAGREVIETDLRRWDYKHQVLATAHVPPWRVLAWLKLIELVVQLRPRAVIRLLSGDARMRAVTRWYYRIGWRVFWREITEFLTRGCRSADRPRLARFWSLPPDVGERALDERSRSLRL
jgi:anaerobic magnesium-protoporphyrin IX monomethyl ester cyclase